MTSPRSELKVIEFYSGIGGMHFAMSGTGLPFCIVGAFDINTTANKVYIHNFPNTDMNQRNIEGLSAKEYDKLKAEVFLMSPPCQPFTRVGNQRASDDPRTKSFLHILDILQRMENPPNYILMENVKGFDESDTRELFIATLEKTGYVYQEFLLSPNQFGIPNSRLRYYLLAKKKPLRFHFQTSKKPIETLSSWHCCSFKDTVINGQEPCQSSKDEQLSTDVTCTCSSKEKRIDKCKAKHDNYNRNFKSCMRSNLNNKLNEIKDFVVKEPEMNLSEFYLSEKTLGRFGLLLDIVTPSSNHSCCFTKAYGHYVEGTGSVFTEFSEQQIKSCFEECQSEKLDETDRGKLLSKLKLRYFTPREIANLMCFPQDFGFPEDITKKQQFRLLGNSLNVLVVTELLNQCLLVEHVNLCDDFS